MFSKVLSKTRLNAMSVDSFTAAAYNAELCVLAATLLNEENEM